MSIKHMKHKLEKQQIIQNERLHDKDTGSTQVQIALLRSKLSRLQNHLNKNHKDQTVKRVITQIKSKLRKV